MQQQEPITLQTPLVRPATKQWLERVVFAGEVKRCRPFLLFFHITMRSPLRSGVGGPFLARRGPGLLTTSRAEATSFAPRSFLAAYRIDTILSNSAY